MPLVIKKIKNLSKWAIFCLFFCSLIAIFVVLVPAVQAAFIEPQDQPPEMNTPDYLTIDGADQAKSGALRLGTDDVATPFTYQLEVVGEGALVDNSIIDNDLEVGQSTEQVCTVDADCNVAGGYYCFYSRCKKEILYVDAENNRVCIGRCLGVDNTKLEVSGQGMIINAEQSDNSLVAISSNSEAIYGSGLEYGVQGVAFGASNYGILAVSPISTAIRGYNTSTPAQYSSVAGISGDGIGIYGANNYIALDTAGLWAAYFKGRLESNKDVTGTKLLPIVLQNSLVPYTSGQAVQEYPISNQAVEYFDGTHLWLLEKTSTGQLYKVRAADAFQIFKSSIGDTPSDVLFDGNFIWVVISGDDEVKKIDPFNGAVACTATLAAGDYPQSIAFDGLYYWVTTDTGQKVYQLDSGCNEENSYDTGYNLGKIIFDGSHLWAVAHYNDMVIKINPSTGESVGYVNVVGDYPLDIIFDNNFYWVANYADDTVTAFYLDNGLPQVFGVYTTGDEPYYLVFDGMYIWVGNKNGQSLTRILAGDPTQIKNFDLGVEPTGLVFDGTYLWVSSVAKLMKIYAGSGFGAPDLSDALTLQFNSPLNQQFGHVGLAGSARVGGDIDIDGDIETENNVWGEQEGGDTFTSIVYGDAWFNTGELQAMQGANNILSFLETAGGTLLVGIEGNNIYKSIDSGANWTDTSGLTDVGMVYTLLEDPSEPAIYAGTGFNGDVFKSIDDGDTWTNTANLSDSGTDATVVFALLLASDGTIFAATDGEVFKTNDGGTSWVVTGDLENATWVLSLLEASDGTLYAGTNSMGAADVFKSVDGGNNWASLHDSEPALTSNNGVKSLVESSFDNKIYAATAPFGEIAVTADQGDSWTESVNFGDGEVNSLIEASDGSFSLYAAVGGPGGYWSHGVYKSIDNGSTWPETGELTGSIYVNQLFESSDGNTIYAAAGVYSGLFKTTDQGTSWQVVSYLDDVGSIADAHTIQALLEASNGTFYASSNNGDVFRSYDRGDTWGQTAHLPGVSVANTLLEASDGTVYVGTYPNGDVFKTTDQGNNWVNTANLTGAAAVNSLIQARNGMFLFAGTNQDVFRSTNGGVSWQAMGGPKAQSIIEAVDGTLYAAEDNDVYKSTDIGDSWNLAGSTTAGTNINVLVEDNAGNIYAAINTGSNVYKSTDQGVTWNETAGALDVNSSTYQFALIKGSNGAIYVGTGGGDKVANVWETTDAGANWTRLGNPYLNDAIAGCNYVYSLMESSDGTLHAGTRAEGDVVKLELAAMPVNTYTCPAGHFVKNIYTNVLGEVYRIECRGL